MILKSVIVSSDCTTKTTTMPTTISPTPTTTTKHKGLFVEIGAKYAIPGVEIDLIKKQTGDLGEA